MSVGCAKKIFAFQGLKAANPVPMCDFYAGSLEIDPKRPLSVPIRPDNVCANSGPFGLPRL